MSSEPAPKLPAVANEEAWCPTRAAPGMDSVECLIDMFVGIVETELVGACFAD